MQKFPHSFVSSIAFCVLPLLVQADVLSWRNGGDGAYPKAQPPLDWESTDSTLWTTPFRESNASPILVDGKLFFTEEPTALVCVNSETGELLWRQNNSLLDLLGFSDEEIQAAKATIAESERLDKEIARKQYERRRLQHSESSATKEEIEKRRSELRDEYTELEKQREELRKNDPYGNAVLPVTHPSNGYCSYTPVSDGKKVFACFGSSAVVAFDLKGHRLWHRILDETDHSFGGSVSPLLIDGKLIVRFSDYVALDPQDGREIWRAPSRVNFGTPVAFELENKAYLFTSRGEVIRISDGRKLTEELVEIRSEDRNWAVFNSPVLVNDRLYTVRGVGGEEGDVYQFRIPDNTRDLEQHGLELVWRKDVRKRRYYASPLLIDGLLYLFSDNHWLMVLDADSGELVYEHRIEGMQGVAYPSLVRAGNLIFAGSESGQVAFFKPGRRYEEISRSEVPDYRSTPLFEGNRAYLRTLEDIRAIQ